MSERTGSCPNCGAEIRFRWSGAVQTTCPACRSVLVRHDADLTRVGVVGDVPPAMSRIQLGTEGRFRDKSFEVVGRIVYRHGRGHWSEWHIRMSDGSSAWLSDAQGEYVVTRAEPRWKPLKEPPKPGTRIRGPNDREWFVASVTTAAYAGVEGELPFEYWDKSESVFADLKSGTDSFATIDYSEDPPLAFVGEYESFIELRLTNLRDADAPGPEVRTRSLSCPKCGAPIQLHTGDLARGVACAACTAVLDVTDAGLSIVAAEQAKVRKVTPVIPLGSVGSMKGVQWRTIGLQVRSITVDDLDYFWREYLLWNADAGFRYLTEYDGHWNDVTVLRGVPTLGTEHDHQVARHLGKTFKHFQQAVAKTVYVVGEFPWEIRVNDTVATDDYVAPPLMLSKETTADEVTWSLGTYTDPARIREAFRLKDPMRKPVGIFANQPNPFTDQTRDFVRMFAVFLVILAVVFLGRRLTARNESVFAESYRLTTTNGRVDNPPAFTTRPFELRGGTSNVEIRIETDAANSWAFFNIALLPTTGGRGFEVAREVSHYFGVDGGESWREGSPTDRAMLSRVPAGSYYLLVDVERDPAQPNLHYEILVRRDVPRTWPFLAGIVLLVSPVVFAFASHTSFDMTRWQESDYSAAEEEEE